VYNVLPILISDKIHHCWPVSFLYQLYQSGMLILTVVHTTTTIDLKHTLPKVVTPQDSSDNGSTYALKIPAISKNPFDSFSLDKSEDSGLNPLDKEMMFSDIHSDGFWPVLHRHQQKKQFCHLVVVEAQGLLQI
jgi:hypothetical protein